MLNTRASLMDFFCGCGGSSDGMAQAGYEIEGAANHSELAIASHSSNFPGAKHYCVDISQYHPKRFRHTTCLWASPECDFHTNARGEKRWLQPDLFGDEMQSDLALRSRATAWDVIRATEYHQYKLVFVENVVEFNKWVLFGTWLESMVKLGYHYRILSMNSMFFGAPQSRDRMYTVFWRDGIRAPDLEFRPRGRCENCGEVEAMQVWKPGRRVGKYRQQYTYACPKCAREMVPYFTGAWTAINWSLPLVRIGDRKYPLKDKTMQRIEAGLRQHGYGPMVVDTAFSDKAGSDLSGRSTPVSSAFPTQTSRQTFGLTMPFVTRVNHYSNESSAVSEPFRTQTSDAHFSLTVPPAFLTIFKNHGGLRPVSEPFSTIHSEGNDHGLLVLNYFKNEMTSVAEPFGTVTSIARNALVEPADVINECGFRMVAPSETQLVMSFRPDYKVLGNNRQRVCQFGNAVTPVTALAIGERGMAVL